MKAVSLRVCEGGIIEGVCAKAISIRVFVRRRYQSGCLCEGDINQGVCVKAVSFRVFV